MRERYLEGLADGDDGVDEVVVAEVREGLQGREQRVAGRAVDGLLERALDVAEEVGRGGAPEREEREGAQCLREAHFVRRLEACSQRDVRRLRPALISCWTYISEGGTICDCYL